MHVCTAQYAESLLANEKWFYPLGQVPVSLMYGPKPALVNAAHTSWSSKRSKGSRLTLTDPENNTGSCGRSCDLALLHELILRKTILTFKLQTLVCFFDTRIQNTLVFLVVGLRWKENSYALYLWDNAHASASDVCKTNLT